MPETTLTLESIERFRNWLNARGRSALTVKAYSTDLRIFLSESGMESLPLPDEYQELGLAWLQMNRKRLKPKTTLRRRTSLTEFGKWAMGDGSDLFDDWIGPTPGRTMPKPLAEGMDGIQRMIDAATRERHKALVALCGHLGCRVAEAVSLMPSSINAQSMAATIRGKGDKTRTVPITEEAWDVLAVPVTRAMIEKRPIVGIDERYARRRITELGVLAGLTRRVASHDLRATLATHLYDKTNNLRYVQEVLGHASIKTTQLYLGIDFESIREGMRP
jgi:site-specific recombinase XerD